MKAVRVLDVIESWGPLSGASGVRVVFAKQKGRTNDRCCRLSFCEAAVFVFSSVGSKLLYTCTLSSKNDANTTCKKKFYFCKTHVQ